MRQVNDFDRSEQGSAPNHDKRDTMSDTRHSADLPTAFTDEDDLEEFMSRPDPRLEADLAALDGDIMVLGVGGKMGPTLARLAKRAAPDKTVIGVARFSEPGLADRLQGPSAGHPLGMDDLGRDVLARLVFGARASLLASTVVIAVSVTVGLLLGGVAGYGGSWVDDGLMRIVDILYALPFMFLVILLMVLFGRNIVLIFFAIGAINWLDMARQVGPIIL